MAEFPIRNNWSHLSRNLLKNYAIGGAKIISKLRELVKIVPRVHFSCPVCSPLPHDCCLTRNLVLIFRMLAPTPTFLVRVKIILASRAWWVVEVV